jgi:hypothetical protein
VNSLDLREMFDWVWIRFSLFRICHEHDDEPAGSIKGSECFDQLNDYQSPKYRSVTYNYKS